MKMKYIIIKPQNPEEKLLFARIQTSASNLYNKLGSINLAESGLSPYNQKYLNNYLQEYTFYIRFYTQVLITTLRELKKPVEDSVFVDYGGGSGFFSFLAKDLGFKTVVYNDIYDVSVADTKILSKETGILIDHFVCGDIDVLADQINQSGLEVDLICSFEVIEHIYNLENWFRSAQKINGAVTLVFSSSANIKNPYIVQRLKKAQKKAELFGCEKVWGSKERDTIRPFLEIRKEIISELNPGLEANQVERLAKLTRGFNKEDIIKEVKEYLNSGKEIKPLAHPTNTCDPYTGNWSEHFINHKWLKDLVQHNGFDNISIKPGLYTFSENKLVFLIKKILNFLIRGCGSFGLMFSPIYILKVRKK
jgi:2-polyprenyl-3-methyl-5-hydroxy-6-metoxy-1,4-benzoquinol methylase